MKLVLLTGLMAFLFGGKETEMPASTEFEGKISFKVEVELKDNRLNKKEIEKFYGTDKEYFYKEGRYKWLTKNGGIEFEVYNYDLDTQHTITKRTGIDTLFYFDFTQSTDELLSVDSLEIEEVCGVKCQPIKFKLLNENDQEVTRILYFPLAAMRYPRPYYKDQAGMCNNLIHHTYGGSIPLKLILDIKGVPFRLVYTATKIKEVQLADSEFQVDNRLPKTVLK